jgi:hypothetical protein
LSNEEHTPSGQSAGASYFGALRFDVSHDVRADDFRVELRGGIMVASLARRIGFLLPAGLHASCSESMWW